MIFITKKLKTMDLFENTSNKDNNPFILSETSQSNENNGKCAFPACCLQSGEKLKCSARGCNRILHRECYKMFIMAKLDLPPLPGNVITCSKLHMDM